LYSFWLSLSSSALSAKSSRPLRSKNSSVLNH
jgi:hypothetical protein